VDVLTLPVPSTPYNGNVTVTTAGTRVQLSGASVPVKFVIIRAHIANTGTIYVGDSAVAAANGYRLTAGEPILWPIDNLNKLYVDASVNGEGVSYAAGA
jgi:hypothetical protein